MKQKIINFHIITRDINTGYGKATSNMIDVFKNSGAKINILMPGQRPSYADIDFYLRPPPWNFGVSKRRIAYFYWEALPLPDSWANQINTIPEIWAPCPLVAQACKLAGFSGKMHIVPTPAKAVDLSKIKNILIDGIDDDYFIFYSIFQWHTRKGWKELITAYYEEFSLNEKVCLIIKTNPIHESLRSQIFNDVLSIKNQFSFKETPKIFLITNILLEEEILSIHKSGHCYVSTHHGEGWGMPIHDALLCGKQVIATKFGGVLEFIDDSNFHPIPFSMQNVSDMDWNGVYSPKQKWAQPDVESTKKLMRNVFTNYKKYIEKNMLIKENINKLLPESISQTIKELL